MATKKRGRPAATPGTVSIYIRIPRELRADLQRAAAREERQLGAVVVRAVRAYLEGAAHG